MSNLESNDELTEILNRLYRKAGITEVHNNLKEFKFNGVPEAREAIQRLIVGAKHHAWNEGYDNCWNYHVSEGAIGKNENPYPTLNTKQVKGE